MSGTSNLSLHRYRYSSTSLDGCVGTRRVYRAGVLPSDNEWHLLTLTVDYISSTDYTATIYLDGNVIVTDAQMTGAKGLVADGTNFYIGAMRDDGVLGYVGQFDDIRIYNRVLMQAEIQALMP